MLVHEGFLARRILDPQDAHMVVLHLDLVMFGIHFHRVLRPDEKHCWSRSLDKCCARCNYWWPVLQFEFFGCFACSRDQPKATRQPHTESNILDVARDLRLSSVSFIFSTRRSS